MVSKVRADAHLETRRVSKCKWCSLDSSCCGPPTPDSDHLRAPCLSGVEPEEVRSDEVSTMCLSSCAIVTASFRAPHSSSRVPLHVQASETPERMQSPSMILSSPVPLSTFPKWRAQKCLSTSSQLYVAMWASAHAPPEKQHVNRTDKDTVRHAIAETQGQQSEWAHLVHPRRRHSSDEQRQHENKPWRKRTSSCYKPDQTKTDAKPLHAN